MQYFPLTLPFYLGLIAIIMVLIALVELNVLAYAYEKMGVQPRYVFSLLILSLLGSYINIPVARLPDQEVVSNQIVSYFGVQYIVPTVKKWPGTIIAVNLGGAVIPTLLSIYLLRRNRLYLRGLIGVIAVAFFSHMLAHPVRGVGIAMPTFIPPLLAAIVAITLSWRHAAPLAYICGSLGTLIGADLLNLDKIQGLGAPIASIGGAGTFDGIFLTGILAVLLTGPFAPTDGDYPSRNPQTHTIGE